MGCRYEQPDQEGIETRDRARATTAVAKSLRAARSRGHRNAKTFRIARTDGRYEQPDQEGIETGGTNEWVMVGTQVATSSPIKRA